MKVALIASPYPLEEAPSPPLGLCYAAAAFEAAGADVRILDYIVRHYSAEKLVAELTDFEPDVIGTTSVTLNFFAAANILKTAKEHFPDSVTIMGGPHVSFDYHNTLKRYPEIDIIVAGEGEQTIMELLPAIHERNIWSTINGIAFMDKGVVHSTGTRELIHDLDRLPLPARHLLPMSRYLAMGFPINIITSRGCPSKCIFCQGRRMVGSRVRSRDPRLVVDEIESLLAFGFERINFSDDFFTSNFRRVKEICTEIRHRGLVFSWSVFARADSVTQELLRVMRDAGCDTVFFGFESGNQEMLNRIKKRIKLDRVRKAVADCKAIGMNVSGSFIVGLPGETMETLMDSHRFAQELDVNYGYHFLAPFPGTDIKENIDQYDLELLTNNWNDFDANRPIVRTSCLYPEDMNWFVENYYSRYVREDEAKMEKNYQNGTLDNQNKLRYVGKQKLDIVFRLLSEDILENAPPLPLGNGLVPVKSLVEYLTGRLDKPMEFVNVSIQHLFERGYIQYQVQNQKVIWHWRSPAQYLEHQASRQDTQIDNNRYQPF